LIAYKIYSIICQTAKYPYVLNVWWLQGTAIHWAQTIGQQKLLSIQIQLPSRNKLRLRPDQQEIASDLNLSVFFMFMPPDDDVRLARRITRDVEHRGRDVKGCLEQYTKFVKPAFDQFVGPSRRYADVIIPWQRGDNLVAIDLITEHIRTKLQQHHLRRIYPNLEVIPSNYQVCIGIGVCISCCVGLC
jgi:hypothetical protein